MQNTDINTMTPDELRTNLIDVCRVRDKLYAALDGKAHELAQRDQRIAELETQNVAMLDELTRKRQDWALAETEKAALKRHVTALEKRVKRSEEYNRYLTRPRTTEPLPFAEFMVDSDQKPADLSMRGGIEAFTEECAHHALTGE